MKVDTHLHRIHDTRIDSSNVLNSVLERLKKGARMKQHTEIKKNQYFRDFKTGCKFHKFLENLDFKPSSSLVSNWNHCKRESFNSIHWLV